MMRTGEARAERKIVTFIGHAHERSGNPVATYATIENMAYAIRITARTLLPISTIHRYVNISMNLFMARDFRKINRKGIEGTMWTSST